MLKRFLCRAFGHMFHYSNDCTSISCTACGKTLQQQ